VGMKITITAGTGVGQVAAITDYDPETKTYTVGPWTRDPLGPGETVAPDSTSKYKIEYKMEGVPGYTASAGTQTDTYDVVLTAPPAPGTTVTINLTPALTRTYNAKRAFIGPDYGAREAVQVSVSGPDVIDNNGQAQLVFTNQNWNLPKTVTVTAIADHVVD